MKFVIEPTITKEYLLEKNTQETYLSYYLGIPVKKGLFKSPLRNDQKPTCSFYTNKRGDIIFKDFSGEFYGNFIDVVRHIFKCSYFEALEIIAKDFGYLNNKININIPVAKPFIKPDITKIQVELKDFTKEELLWWKQYGITLNILNKFNVYSCKTIFLNDNIFSFSDKNNFIFGYFRKDTELERWRIYMPFRKEYRFISNWTKDMIQGGKQLQENGEYLVITKSLKDVMTLYSFNIPAIAPCSETFFINDSQLLNLKDRFKQIFLLYDTDLTGIKNMNIIRRKYSDIKCLWIPKKYKTKDISDFYKTYGRLETMNLIKSVNNG
jgi:hypothetical protein